MVIWSRNLQWAYSHVDNPIRFILSAHTLSQGGRLMHTIVFIGSSNSGSSNDAIIAAEKLGFYTVLLTNRRRFLEKRTEFPHVHEMILANLDDYDEIRQKLEFLQLQGKEIMAISSFIDPYVYTAALLGTELGLPAQTPSAISQMLDKISMRNLLKDTSYSPFFIEWNDAASPDLDISNHLPMVVKSPRSNGSKDVQLVTKRNQLESYIAHLKNKYPEQSVLLEEYVPGQQYLVEVLVHQGTPHIVTVVRQCVTQNKRFIVTGYSVLPMVPKNLREPIHDMVRVVIDSLQMKTGACHIEFKMTCGQCKVIEVNPRIAGGAMNRMIETAFGINLVRETLKSQLGDVPDLEPEYRRHVFTQYVTVPERGILERVTGKKRASLFPGVEAVYVKPRRGAILQPPTSMGQRYAYVMAAADSEKAAEETAKTAATFIQFHLKPLEMGFM